MVYLGSPSRKRRICERVRQVRIEQFGDSHGAQKRMAKELGIPYTTYRGYEKNRTNEEFLIMLSKRNGVSLHWLLCAEEGLPEQQIANNIVLSANGKLVRAGGYLSVIQRDDSMEPTLLKKRTRALH